MSLVVTGTIGIDAVQTPHGQVQGVLGGSAVYFSVAASLFTPVRLVGVVGADFPPSFRQALLQRKIDLAGLETRPQSKSFRWSGRYEGSMNEAETLGIELNVLAEKAPAVPEGYRDSRFVFLAATHPRLQQDMVQAFPAARLVVADTRDLWITNEREALTRLLPRVHGVVLNDAEARLFTNEQNLITAGRRILGFGPQFVIVKKGEHGAMLVTRERIVSLPSYPTDRVRDPTGAGDSFAGGMMGFMAAQGEFKATHLHKAMAYGTIAASFTIEDFSVQALDQVTRPQVDARLAEYVAMLRFD